MLSVVGGFGLVCGEIMVPPMFTRLQFCLWLGDTALLLTGSALRLWDLVLLVITAFSLGALSPGSWPLAHSSPTERGKGGRP